RRSFIRVMAQEVAPLLAPVFEAVEDRGGAPAGLDLERVLAWPYWSRVRDAVVLDRNTVRIGGEGSVAAAGLFVNPVGVARRSPDFDVAPVLALVDLAMERGAVAEDGNGGFAIPIRVGDAVEGGVFLSFPFPSRNPWFYLGLLSAFAASTFALTGVVSIVVTASVVRPLERLAAVGRRVAGGDLGAEPPRHPAQDEMAELTESMRAMLRTLRVHREELERESAAAAERAKRAERDLLAAQRLASIGTLAAGIAHEINNPLAGLTNAVRSLRGGELGPERREQYFELVEEGLGRIRDTVGRVLAIAPRGRSPAVVHLAEAARVAAAFVEHRAAREGVSVSLALLEDGDTVRGERGELVQVFLNLLINALDAVAESPPARRSVSFEMRREGDSIVTVVRDTGPGADPAIQERLFDPFFSTKEPGRGTGLGLTVAYAVVRNHGGAIALASPSGGGFEVTVRLPFAE
ncbi:MAG TPA: ATP-binding protein, partial [Planctomycetota bacterium]|nr:ATP-binding protein [Planctomycetota bacterium]